MLSSTARRRKEREGGKAAALQGREKAELKLAPDAEGGGSGKSTICQVLVPGFTRHPGCPGALGSVPWLLATSCSRVVAQAVTALPATRI